MNEIGKFQGQGEAIVPGCCATGTSNKVMRSAEGLGGLHNLNMIASESLSYSTRSNEPYAVVTISQK